MLQKQRAGEWAETSVMVQSRPLKKSGYSTVRTGYDFGDGPVAPSDGVYTSASTLAPSNAVVSSPTKYSASLVARETPTAVRSASGGFVRERAPRELLTTAAPPRGFVPAGRVVAPLSPATPVDTMTAVPRDSGDLIADRIIRSDARPLPAVDTRTTVAIRTGEELRADRMASDAMSPPVVPGPMINPGFDPSPDGGARGGSETPMRLRDQIQINPIVTTVSPINRMTQEYGSNPLPALRFRRDPMQWTEPLYRHRWPDEGPYQGTVTAPFDYGDRTEITPIQYYPPDYPMDGDVAGLDETSVTLKVGIGAIAALALIGGIMYLRRS